MFRTSDRHPSVDGGSGHALSQQVAVRLGESVAQDAPRLLGRVALRQQVVGGPVDVGKDAHG